MLLGDRTGVGHGCGGWGGRGLRLVRYSRGLLPDAIAERGGLGAPTFGLVPLFARAPIVVGGYPGLAVRVNPDASVLDEDPPPHAGDDVTPHRASVFPLGDDGSGGVVVRGDVEAVLAESADRTRVELRPSQSSRLLVGCPEGRT